MTDAKVNEVFRRYQSFFRGYGAVPTQRAEGITHLDLMNHLAWMCIEGPELIRQGRREKAMRWLGFVQGYLVSHGAYSIDDVKEHSRPERPE